ncbi:hypothetical protein [Allostreptomyces psammosilenae]|uniref:Uncharacterized protein n=1 Tax=Allostreptomyces psammosilenae TaxID=1892865 RepID=A0A853A043_9ACTN|nr:hypothetical protein [Allostreptomyces psammosilenae]NYI04191.1 hypothetical protein [Allostreptomyces psammosilenae]
MPEPQRGRGRRRRPLQAARTAATLPLALALSLTPAAPAAASEPVIAVYDCYSAHVQGSHTVAHAIKLYGDAPQRVTPRESFPVVVDVPPFVADPRFNSEVRQVRLSFLLPADATVVGAEVSGGSAPARVLRDHEVVVLEAEGPFPAGEVIALPSLTLHLRPGDDGAEELSLRHGGATLAEPAFSWLGTGSQGEPHPLACFLPAPVPLTSTEVGPEEPRGSRRT